ncbi:MAG: PDZ domain-containing protein [Gemmatales bacterium]|nr:PDZ domain-containing protein [Gemmatales bacterium]MDW8386056.1 PDZ domain-containing protein [Gemmatales bacterium]
MRQALKAILGGLAAVVIIGSSMALADPQPAEKADAKPAPASFRVPYQLTETKHILVRARINGKGPYHLVMDTGAPALFVSTESAQKHGLNAGPDGWAELDKFEVEGGPVLEKIKARIETPFQVSGMNAMGLPGIRLDGMLGYTVLAQYRIELDLTKPHMIWTRLDWTPPPPRPILDGGQAPTELAAMGSLMKLLQLFMQKRPEPVYVQRGFLGIQLAEKDGGVFVEQVLPGSPAAKAGLRSGDRILRYQEKDFANLRELHGLAAEHAAKKEIALEFERAGKKETVTLRTERGL